MISFRVHQCHKKKEDSIMSFLQAIILSVFTILMLPAIKDMMDDYEGKMKMLAKMRRHKTRKFN